MVTSQPPLLVPSPAVQQPPINQSGVKMHSFREASVERLELVLSLSHVMTTSEVSNVNKVLGTGFMRSLIMKVVNTTATNVATAAFGEGGIYDSIGQVVLHDTNGDLVNLGRGSHWWMLHQYFGMDRFPAAGDSAISGTYATAQSYKTNDANIFSIPSVSGGTGGSFTFWLELPTALNDRDLRCLIGNQDQAQSYDFRTNWGSATQTAGLGVYATPPTNLGTTVQTTYYMSRSVPSLFNPDGSQNQPTPNTYGMLRYWLENTDQGLPGPSQIVHRMTRLGQTMRGFILVLRQASLRANAEAQMPTSIQVKIGDQTLFTEDAGLRRYLMRRRYGFDSPDGVLVYDNIHDFNSLAGQEYGDDWIYTQDITQYQVIATYPSGFTANAGNLLTYLTDDMSIPAGIDPMNV